MLYMYDDVAVSLIPTGAQAVAYYTDGLYANFTAMKAREPQAYFLGIAVSAADTATAARALDVEPGDATNSQAVGWVRAKLAAKVKPVIYTSAGNAQALINELAANGIPRSDYFLWSAHYTGAAHICGSDGYPQADATQFTDTADGRSLDESLVSDAFVSGVFGKAVTPVTPANPNPTIQEGASGAAVSKAQTRLNVWGAKLTVDGSFGPLTLAAVKAFQTKEKLTVDGIVGPATWAKLNATPPKPAPAPAKPVLTWPANVTLQLGSRGTAVTVLQQALHDSGKYGARGLEPIDGVFGPGTETAVKNFQHDVRLTVDGIAGPETRAALGVK